MPRSWRRSLGSMRNQLQRLILLHCIHPLWWPTTFVTAPWYASLMATLLLARDFFHFLELAIILNAWRMVYAYASLSFSNFRTCICFCHHLTTELAIGAGESWRPAQAQPARRKCDKDTIWWNICQTHTWKGTCWMVFYGDNVLFKFYIGLNWRFAERESFQCAVSAYGILRMIIWRTLLILNRSFYKAHFFLTRSCSFFLFFSSDFHVWFFLFLFCPSFFLLSLVFSFSIWFCWVFSLHCF